MGWLAAAEALAALTSIPPSTALLARLLASTRNSDLRANLRIRILLADRAAAAGRVTRQPVGPRLPCASPRGPRDVRESASRVGPESRFGSGRREGTAGLPSGRARCVIGAAVSGSVGRVPGSPLSYRLGARIGVADQPGMSGSWAPPGEARRAGERRARRL